MPSIPPPRPNLLFLFAFATFIVRAKKYRKDK